MCATTINSIVVHVVKVAAVWRSKVGGTRRTGSPDEMRVYCTGLANEVTSSLAAG